MTDKIEFLVENFGSYVKAVVISKIGSIASREDVEDCISDVFCELCKSYDKLPDSADELKFFVAAVAKRRAVDYFRRISHHDKNSGFISEEQLLSIPDKSDVEGEFDKKSLSSALWNAVKSLGEPDSAIIVYRCFYHKKAREIAKILGISTAAVHKRAQRSMKKIREILISQGYDTY